MAAKEKTMDKREQVKPIDGDLSSGQGIVPPHARWQDMVSSTASIICRNHKSSYFGSYKASVITSTDADLPNGYSV